MNRDTPDCSEFILATTRSIRMHPWNQAENSASGTKLGRIAKVILELYTYEEFRSGLEKLLKDGTIILIAAKCRSRDGGRRDGPYHLVKVEKIPSSTPRFYNCWFTDEAGNFLDRTEGLDKYVILNYILLYITADGLPQKIAKFRTPSRAQQILDSLQKP